MIFLKGLANRSNEQNTVSRNKLYAYVLYIYNIYIKYTHTHMQIQTKVECYFSLFLFGWKWKSSLYFFWLAKTGRNVGLSYKQSGAKQAFEKRYTHTHTHTHIFSFVNSWLTHYHNSLGQKKIFQKTMLKQLVVWMK